MKLVLLACLLIGTAAAQCTGSSANLPAKECSAWQDFYDNLDGPNWTVFCKDKRNDPCACNSGLGNPCKGGPTDHFSELMENLGDGPVPNPWHEPDAGVCCQNRTDGLHITQLAFALNGLNGTVPDSINDLEELDNLSACGNKMTGQLPDMSNTKLQYLRLYQNEFTGTVPATLNNNTALTFLSLGDNNLEGVVPDLTGLTKLTDLYLDCNNLSGTVADDKDRQWKLSGKCFLNAHGALLEKCSKGRDDNAFDCPLPAGADKNCHATCK